MIIQPFSYKFKKKNKHKTLVTTTTTTFKPREFSLLSNFLIGIIKIITDALDAETYLALFTPFIQKYFTLLLRQEENKKENTVKCNLYEAILLRVPGIALKAHCAKLNGKM